MKDHTRMRPRPRARSIASAPTIPWSSQYMRRRGRHVGQANDLIRRECLIRKPHAWQASPRVLAAAGGGPLSTAEAGGLQRRPSIFRPDAFAHLSMSARL